MTKSLTHLAAKIRAFATTGGYPRNVIAAANYATDLPVVLIKIRSFVDEDGWIEWNRIAGYVDESGWSSGEKDMIRFGCSLAGHICTDCGGWDLGSMIRGENAEAAVEAVRFVGAQ